MLLLDTCTLLWLGSDQEQLSPRAKDLLRANAGALYFSSISAFEIALKSEKGRLKLPLPAAEWIEEALHFHGIVDLPVDRHIATRSAQLPPIHADPCDRLIIATALRHKLRILTCDPKIGAYPEAQVEW